MRGDGEAQEALREGAVGEDVEDYFMPRTLDFRNYSFATSRIDASGKNVGRRVYWKLYAIENVVRIIVHSILTAQISPNWWTVAVNSGIQGRVCSRMAQYANQPWHTPPGRHEVYYTFLPDLNEIIRANSHLFRPHVRDIDQWIARIEQIRLPRNIVGHMNWPSTIDRNRIDVFHADITHLATQLITRGMTLAIP